MSPSMVMRAFSAPALPVADNWFHVPVQSLTVKILGGFSATADGACPVELPNGGLGFMKPRPGTAQNLLIAREKICADLGHILELPVAPVLVLAPSIGIRPNHSAISLSCLPSARHWGQGGNQHLDRAIPALEALRVFWTWVGDTDHGGHPDNLVYEATQDGVNVVAFDHAYALCRWCGQDPMAAKASLGYGTASRFEGIPARKATMAKIAALEMSQIEHLVERLDMILTKPEQARIVNILQYRRDRLHDIISL